MNQIKFALSFLTHPFESFLDMKLEKKGRLFTAIVLMLVYYFTNILDIQARAFLFNANYNTPIDLMYQLRIIALPIIIFVVANWSITTLMEGKGTMRDIIMVVGYSFVPLILMKILTALLSNVMSLNESVYVTALDIIGMTWFALLIYIGLQSVHDFEYGKTISSFLLTFISMGIIIFICLLFFSLVQEIFGFLYSIYREITLRI